MRPARLVWTPAWTAWALWTLFLLGLAAVAWLDQLLRQAGRPELVQIAPEYALETLGLVSAATVGAVLANRRPRHPVGWLLLAFGLLTITSAAAGGYVGYALLASPGSLPAADLAVVAFFALSDAGTPCPSWPSPCCSRRPGRCPPPLAVAGRNPGGGVGGGRAGWSWGSASS